MPRCQRNHLLLKLENTGVYGAHSGYRPDGLVLAMFYIQSSCFWGLLQLKKKALTLGAQQILVQIEFPSMVITC